MILILSETDEESEEAFMNTWAASLQGILSEASGGTCSCHAEDGLLPWSRCPVRMLRYPTYAQESDVVSSWRYVSEASSDVDRSAKNIVAADFSAPLRRSALHELHKHLILTSIS